MRGLGRVVAVVVLAAGSFVVLGRAPAAPTAAVPIVPLPASMAAIGDSFTRGFANGPPDCNSFAECVQNSWSTGTSTAVNSHYQRLLALNPALSGNATNAAVPGSLMSAFVSQVGTIGASQPEYVTVLLGGGDICFGPTATAVFRAQFRAGMDALFAASPSSRVLVASIWNFESLREAIIAGNPAFVWGFCGSFMNATPAARALLTAQIVDYNAVLEAECATYANCLFDGRALFDHVWTADEISPVDSFHPSVDGEAMISEVLFNAGYWGPRPSAPTALVDVAPDFAG